MIIKCQIPAVHHFSKREFSFRPITPEGIDKFGARLASIQWEELRDLSSSEAAVKLSECLNELVVDCFELVTIRTKSTDNPWISRPIKRAIRSKRRLYAKYGKCPRYNRKRKEVEEMIEEAKKKYFEKLKKKQQMHATRNSTT